MDYTVHYASLHEGVPWDDRWFSSLDRPIREIFWDQSNKQIQLTPDKAPALFDFPIHQASKYDLAEGLRRLTTNVPGEKPINNIGVIIAEYWLHNPSILGIMFDTDLPYIDEIGTPLDVNYNRIPREGCAVFVRALAAEGYSDPTYFDRTVMHEIGHIFNLPHDPTGRSFMSQTDENLSEYAFRRFNDAHCAFLAQCPESEYVQPGGSDFDVRGHLALLDRRRGNTADTVSRQRLSLQISFPRTRFLMGEPIILDVALRPTKHIEKVYSIPNELDPGHERFQVWIQHPNGETRRFVPLHHYCSAPIHAAVSYAKPLRNNINLFWGKGGTPFSTPGVYAISCVFMTGEHTYIKSKTLEIEVSSFFQCNDREREKLHLLSGSDVGRTFYYRGQYRSTQALKKLKSLIKKYPNCQESVFPKYVFGRHLWKLAKDEKSTTLARRQFREAQGLLRTVEKSPHLGRECQHSAKGVLREMSSAGAS